MFLNNIIKKNITTHIFFNYYSIAFNVFWSIILIPFFLEYIDIKTYGFWLATGNVITLIAIFDPGISEVVRQKAGDLYGKKDNDTLIPLLWASIILSIIFAIIIMIIGYIFSFFIFDIINVNDITLLPPLKTSYFIALFSTCIMIVNFALNSFCIGIMSSLAQGLIFVISSLTSVFLIFYTLLNGYGIISIPLSLLSKSIFTFLLTLIYIYYRTNKEGFKNSFSINYLKEILSASFTNFSGRLGILIITNLDSIIVARFLGPQFVVSLSIMKKIFEFFKMIFERTFVSFLPSINLLNGQNDFEKIKMLLNKIKPTLYLSLIFLITFTVIFNPLLITKWVGTNYYLNDFVNILLGFSTTVLILWFFMMNLLFTLGEIKYVSKINMIQSILTLIASIVGIYFFDIYGFIIFFTLSFIYSLLSLYSKLSVKYKLVERIKLKNLVHYLRLLAFMFFFSLFYHKYCNAVNSWGLLIILSSSFLAIFIIVAYFNYPKNQRINIYSLLKNN